MTIEVEDMERFALSAAWASRCCSALNVGGRSTSMCTEFIAAILRKGDRNNSIADVV